MRSFLLSFIVIFLLIYIYSTYSLYFFSHSRSHCSFHIRRCFIYCIYCVCGVHLLPFFHLILVVFYFDIRVVFLY